jgi:enamine deaminase RidA (YjgF/YER057c/UK114 family)
MPIYDNLQKLNIVLPAVNSPVASYVLAAESQGLVYLSGHLAKRDGKPWIGQLGSTLTTEEGKAAARNIAIDLIATLHDYLGDLNRVKRIVKVVSMVNSRPDFTEQHLVTNGCSDLLVAVFGDAGKHARSAVGVAQLPLGACVEIEMVVELAD